MHQALFSRRFLRFLSKVLYLPSSYSQGKTFRPFPMYFVTGLLFLWGPYSILGDSNLGKAGCRYAGSLSMVWLYLKAS